MDWTQGFRKVSKKARHGKKHKTTGVHSAHRKRLPTTYDRESRRERQRCIEDLRLREADEIPEED